MCRRTAPLVAYKLRCERDPLSGRLGPPDFYPPTSNCAEEILNRESCQSGYKELIEGIEEPKEVTLTLTNNPALWAKQSVNRYKEVLLFVCLLCLGWNVEFEICKEIKQ
jgi:hypothetical protein